MNIASTQTNFQTYKPQGGGVAQGTSFQAVPSEDLANVDKFVESQDRSYGSQIASGLGGAIGMGLGGTAGTFGAILVSAATGLSGWSMVGAGVVGLVAGAGLGGYIGSR